MKEAIEQQIREILATESRAIVLSERLFSTDGLFGQMAKSESERRALTQSSLFKEAQQRLTALQQKEAADFSRTVSQAKSSMPDNGYLVKVERAEVG